MNSKPTFWMVLAVLAAIVVSIAVNTGIAFAAKSLDAGGTRVGLMPAAYAPATALGIIAATVGWSTVRRRSTRPAALLRVLVPAVLVVSLIPGVVLIVLGDTVLDVIGLWVMHLVVTAVTVTTLSRALPVSDTHVGRRGQLRVAATRCRFSSRRERRERRERRGRRGGNCPDRA